MNHRLLIVILASLSMIGALSIDAYLPAMPAIAAHFSVSMTAVQQSLSVYLFAFAFMTLFYGTLSDSFGRRPVILYSMVVYLLGSLGAGLAANLEQLLVFRFIQGLSAGAGGVVGRAIVGDMLKGAEAQRTMSYISMVFGLAPAIAPILGGWLQINFGWRWIFGFIAIFSVALLVTSYRCLPESLPREQRHAFHFSVIVRNYWSVARHGEFMLRCFATAMTFSGIMIYVGAAPSYVMDILHLKETSFGWLFIPLIGGMTLGSLVSGKVSHSWTPRFTIALGYIIMLVSGLMSLVYTAYVTPAIPWAVVPIGCYAFGMALASPAMTVTTLELFPNVRGLAASLQTFMFMLVFSVCSGAICPHLFGHAYLMALATVIGLVLSLFAWFIGLRLSHAPVDEEIIVED